MHPDLKVASPSLSSAARAKPVGLWDMDESIQEMARLYAYHEAYDYFNERLFDATGQAMRAVNRETSHA